MLWIRAEALDPRVSRFHTYPYFFLAKRPGVGLPLAGHASPAASAFCYHVQEHRPYLMGSSPSPSELDAAATPTLQKSKPRLGGLTRVPAAS